MVPTLTATLGVKGHRPVVGTWDCKHLLYVFAVVNLVTAAVHANTLESPKDAKKKTGLSKTRRMQAAFASLNLGLKVKPSLPKNAFDLSRSFTGRLTKIFVDMATSPSLFLVCWR